MGKGSNSRCPLSADPLHSPTKKKSTWQNRATFLSFSKTAQSFQVYRQRKTAWVFFWGGRSGRGSCLSGSFQVWHEIYFSPPQPSFGERRRRETKASRAPLECPQRKRAAAQMFLKTSLEFRASDTVRRTRLWRKIHQSPIYLKGYF